MIVLAFAKPAETLDGVGEVDELARRAGEDFGNMERLRQEALDLARARHRDLVLFRELVHAENGDDVLQRFVTLQALLNHARGIVMLLADNERGEHARCRVERIHCRIDAFFRNRAAQHRGGVQMRERGCRRRVGQVIGRHVDRLHRGDRTLVGGGDAFLQRAHVGGERRLIAHRRWNAAEQRRHFRAGLRETEDVVDEEQHVLALIAEILGDGETGEADAGAGAGRLVHLTEYEGRFRLPVGIVMRPSVPTPTGTRIGAPVSLTSWPRTRPSVVSIAMVRTVDSPRCCATSSTRRLPPFLVSMAFRMAGRWPSNCTSTTAPMTCVMCPVTLAGVAMKTLSFEFLLSQTTVSLTGILPLVAFEYRQTV